MLSIELGTEILKQGANLKLSGAERITDINIVFITIYDLPL